MTEEDNKNALVWYQNETDILRFILISLHQQVEKINPDAFENFKVECPILMQQQEQYQGLRSILVSMKECVDLLEFVELKPLPL